MQQRYEPVTRPRHATRAKHSRPASALVSAVAQWLRCNQTHLTCLTRCCTQCKACISPRWSLSLPHCALSSCSSVQTNCRCLRCCVGCENVGKVAMTMVSNEIGRTLVCPGLGPNSAQLPSCLPAPGCAFTCATCPPRLLQFCILYLVLSLPFQPTGNWLAASLPGLPGW